MKYMIFPRMSQRTWDELSSTPSEALGEFLGEFVTELTRTGELLGTGGFSAPAEQRAIALRDGETIVTDGVDSDEEEVLGGYFVVSCGSLDRATEIAAELNRSPGPVPRTGILIRRLLEEDE